MRNEINLDIPIFMVAFIAEFINKVDIANICA